MGGLLVMFNNNNQGSSEHLLDQKCGSGGVQVESCNGYTASIGSRAKNMLGECPAPLQDNEAFPGTRVLAAK